MHDRTKHESPRVGITFVPSQNPRAPLGRVPSGGGGRAKAR